MIEQEVNTRIIPRSGEPHVLDYVMRQNPQGWHAVDVCWTGRSAGWRCSARISAAC